MNRKLCNTPPLTNSTKLLTLHFTEIDTMDTNPIETTIVASNITEVNTHIIVAIATTIKVIAIISRVIIIIETSIKTVSDTIANNTSIKEIKSLRRMKMKNPIIPTLILILIVVTGCASLPASNQTQGTVAGGAIGALLGSTIGDGRGAVWATAAGAIGGALVGSHIGKRLDARDHQAMSKATYSALENTRSNTKTTWSNPDSGNSGSVVPTNTFEMADGSYCREYISMVEIEGKTETA